MSEILESPIEFVANHIKTYVATNGEDGHMWQGVPCLLLTTTGRKSGSQRRCALIYGIDGNDYIVVASRGGDANHPLWYKNMLDEPTATLQVKADVFQATASTIAEGADRDRLWNAMAAIWPDYNTYAEKTDRRIPLVRLTRI
jgi:deazaflavin-dependent oxidoreductase (nitroreductase family)